MKDMSRFFRMLPHRILRLKSQNLLTILLLISITGMVVYFYNEETGQSSRSNWHQVHEHIIQKRKLEESIKTTVRSTIPPRSWRRNHRFRNLSWPTTERQIFTTQYPFATVKYYTYIEDFIANWDKYPLSSETNDRVQHVLETAMRLKNRKLFSPALTPKQRKTLYELLSNFDVLAKKEGIRYFAYGGTLLGSFRHHELIPYDDDVDIIVDDRDREKLRKAVERDRRTFSMSTLSPDHFKLHSKSGEFTNLYHDWTYPYLDISFYKLNETHLRDLAMTYGRWWEYKITDIFPLHQRPLGPLMIPAPKDTYKYLLETYDLSTCSESYYSHQLEMVVRCRMVATSCEKLPYAFVHRSVPRHGPGVNETLMQNGSIIHWKIVQEPDYQANIRNPYSLTL